MDERTLKDELVLQVDSELLDDELGVMLGTTEDDDGEGDSDGLSTQGKRDFSRFAESPTLPR